MEYAFLLATVNSWTALGVSSNNGGRLLNPVKRTCKNKMKKDFGNLSNIIKTNFSRKEENTLKLQKRSERRSHREKH